MRRKVENYVNQADIQEGYDLTARELNVLRNLYGNDLCDLMYACFKFGFTVGVKQTESNLKQES